MSKLAHADQKNVSRRTVLQLLGCGGAAVALPRPLWANPQSNLVESSGGKLRGTQANGINPGG